MIRSEFAPVFLRFLQKYDRFLISGHIRPDGDSAGACALMSYVLSAMGKETLVCFDPEADRYTRVLAPFAQLPEGAQGKDAGRFFRTGSDFALLLVDCCEPGRTGRAESAMMFSRASLAVDHHMVLKEACDFTYVESTASSCSEILYHLLKLCEIPLTLEEQKAAFLGIAYDTGGFRHSSTSAETFSAAADLLRGGVDTSFYMNYLFHFKRFSEMKAYALAVDKAKLLGTAKALSKGQGVLISCMDLNDFEKAGICAADAEGVAGELSENQECDVCCYFREIEPGTVRVNLRSKKIVDVNRVAAAFGGGGHIRAAGCTLKTTVQDAADRVLRVIRNQLSEDGTA